MKMMESGVAVIVLLVAVLVARAMRTGGKAPSSGDLRRRNFTLNSQDGQTAQPARSSRQVGRTLFLSQGFHQRVAPRKHTIFSVTIRQYEQNKRAHPWSKCSGRSYAPEFCAKEGLSFKLLADTKYEVSSSYDSLVNLGVAKLSARHTFLHRSRWRRPQSLSKT